MVIIKEIRKYKQVKHAEMITVNTFVYICSIYMQSFMHFIKMESCYTYHILSHIPVSGVDVHSL